MPRTDGQALAEALAQDITRRGHLTFDKWVKENMRLEREWLLERWKSLREAEAEARRAAPIVSD